jgi:phage shock protein E
VLTAKKILPIALLMILGACATPTISGPAAHTLVREQHALLLDVRSPGEFAGDHLEGAINIPVGDLEARLGELADKKTEPIIVYCRSGHRAARALTMLKAGGFTRAESLGGIGNW